jgi:hypothetical protein
MSDSNDGTYVTRMYVNGWFSGSNIPAYFAAICENTSTLTSGAVMRVV